MATHRENALDYLLKTVRQRLADSGEIWGQRVAANVPSAMWDMPYVVITYSGGGELDIVVGEDSEIVLNIKCVAASLGQSLDGAARIATLLNAEGTQDANSADPLDAGSEWEITTVSQEHVITLTEPFGETEHIHHNGSRFRFGLAAL